MPAIVRGGKRQASKASPAQSSNEGGRKSATQNAAASKKGATPKPGLVIGKRQAIGAFSLSAEAKGWLVSSVLIFMTIALLSTGNRALQISQFAISKIDQQLVGLGIGMRRLHFVGVSPRAAPDIEKALAFTLNQPYALLDLNNIRERLRKVGWVKSVTLRRQFPDILIVSIVERPALAVFNKQGQLFVIDENGAIIPEARAGDFTQLPLVLGEGANEQAAEIISLVALNPQLMERVYAFARIDTRRWDIVLKDHSIIKLPAQNIKNRLDYLEDRMKEGPILDMGLAYIDLRDPEAAAVLGRSEYEASLRDKVYKKVEPGDNPTQITAAPLASP